MKAVLRFIHTLRCFYFFHKPELLRHIKGSHENMTWVACFECSRCHARFIYSEVHQAFLRYDNDAEFKKDITRTYPHIKIEEI